MRPWRRVQTAFYWQIFVEIPRRRKLDRILDGVQTDGRGGVRHAHSRYDSTTKGQGRNLIDGVKPVKKKENE